MRKYRNEVMDLTIVSVQWQENSFTPKRIRSTKEDGDQIVNTIILTFMVSPLRPIDTPFITVQSSDYNGTKLLITVTVIVNVRL